MKKVGILTFHTADNYGAVLQAYALQKCLEDKMLYNVEIIDFSTPLLRNEYRIMYLRSSNIIKNALLKAINICYYFKLKDRKRKFNYFRNNVIKLSKTRYESIEDVKNKIYPYDIFISGSDQVFNPYINYSDIFFLNFSKGKGKKIAYAPSFGVSDFNDAITKRIKPFLEDFDMLSCREQNGAEYLSKIMDKEIPMVLDPVFLLTKEMWQAVATLPSISEKYIFVYDLNGGKNLLRLAKKIAKKKHLPIICCTGNLINYYNGVKCLYNVGPQEFLGYIANAEYVVTDSFHGTSLAILFETKFISYIAMKKTASRLISILSSLGLNDQIITDVEAFNIDDIKWGQYQNRLADLVDKSYTFLQKSVSY